MQTIWVPTKSESNETNKVPESCERGRDAANEWEGSDCLNQSTGNVASVLTLLLVLFLSSFIFAFLNASLCFLFCLN